MSSVDLNMKTRKVNDKEKDGKLAILMDWVDQQIKMGKVPRFADVVEHARQNEEFSGLSSAMVRARLRLNRHYLMNSSQQRPKYRSRKYRSITVNNLGNWHCDIMFFPLSEHYETPPTYRSGALIARDILSRYIYAVPLKKTRNARSMVSAFSTLLQQHQEVFSDSHKVVSVSFDKERSVLSKEVQTFFAENNIKFYSFAFSSSKSKGAENAIRQIRVTLTRLTAELQDKRWWVHLQAAVNAINSRPVIVNGKKLSFAPKDITSNTLKSFLKELHKTTPHIYWSQFEIDNRFVNFLFSPGDLVRPKLLITSSALLGTKRSTLTLEEVVFQIVKQVAYLTPRYTVGKGYLCQRLNGRGASEYFDEDDLALTRE